MEERVRNSSGILGRMTFHTVAIFLLGRAGLREYTEAVS